MSHRLTYKQIKAIRLMAGGMSTIEIGKQLKLRRETISRWRKQPWFMQEYDRVMEDVRADLHNRLVQLVADSIGALSYGMKSSYADAKRTQAALAVLKMLGLEGFLDRGEAEPCVDVIEAEPAVAAEAPPAVFTGSL